MRVLLLIAVALMSMVTTDVAQACGSHGCAGGGGFRFSLQISTYRGYGGGYGGGYYGGGCGYGCGGYYRRGGIFGWRRPGSFAAWRAGNLAARGRFVRAGWAANRANRRAWRWGNAPWF